MTSKRESERRLEAKQLFVKGEGKGGMDRLGQSNIMFGLLVGGLILQLLYCLLEFPMAVRISANSYNIPP